MILNRYFAACEMEAIGLASDGTIPDSSFSASSYYSAGYIPSNGRLNGNSLSWAPTTNYDPSDYLQIDLLYEYVICGVATQGANGINEWTTKYKIRLSMDGTTMVTYQENNVERVSLYKKSCEYSCPYNKSQKKEGPRTLIQFLSQGKGEQRRVYLVKTQSYCSKRM